MNATYSTGNYWRYGRNIVAGVLAAVTMVILAAPAHAAYVTKFCGDSTKSVELEAHYETLTDSSGRFYIGRKWTYLIYHLYYWPGIGDQNNVEIRIYSNGSVIYEYESPDNRKDDRWYGVVLNPSVVTSFLTENYIGIQAVFDYSGWPDQTIACRFGPY